MNCPLYKVSKEAEPDLIEFIKVCRAQKVDNTRCNLEEYERLIQIFPLDPELERKVAISTENEIPIITLDSDSDYFEQSPITVDIEEEIININKTSYSDTAYAVKEHLETQNNLSNELLSDLIKSEISQLEEIFQLLTETLNVDAIFYFGKFLIECPLNIEIIFVYYWRHLFIPKLQEQHCDNLVTLLVQLSCKYPLQLKTEILNFFVKSEIPIIRTILQYFNVFQSTYKSILAKDYILSVGALEDKSLIILTEFINNETEYETLNRLVRMMLSAADDYSTNKMFGKLVLNTIEYLGTNLMLLEQPLKQIIASHKSIWKAKLDKTFDHCLDDSMMFTQSFRE